jgi:hypothetical protein
MSASSITGDQVGGVSVSADLAPALGRLAEAASRVAADALSRKVDGWIRGLEEYAEGPFGRAALEGLKAHLLGKNPVWMALKGAWRGASPALRLVAVLVLLLVLLLAPVALLLLLLGLLFAAIVAGIRAAIR